MTIFKELGVLGLASRLKGISENLLADGIDIYSRLGVDFHPRWFGVYYLLLEHQEMSITDLASRLGQSHPATIKVITPMTKAKIVSSRRCSDDGRKRIVVLTKKGLALQESIEPIWKALHQSISQMFVDLDIDIIYILDRIEDEIRKKPISQLCHITFKKMFLQEVSIIPYTSKYSHSFRSLNEEWLKEWFYVEEKDSELLDHPETILNNGGEIFFAIYEGAAIGTAALIKDSEDRFELAKMAVRKSFRNRGVGRVLITTCLEWLRQRKINFVYLQTSPRLITANRLYQNIGFQETNQILCQGYKRTTKVYCLNLFN